MSEKKDASRDIRDHIMREVRQRCGFGCVLCGLPLYQYDHMDEFAEVQEHDPNNLTLLCNRHHEEKTKKLLPLEKVREADKNPHNRKKGVSPPYDLHYSGELCEVVFGSNRLIGHHMKDGQQVNGIVIDGTSLLAFTCDQGQLFLTLRVFDDDGRPVLLIEQNQLQYSVEPWDICFGGRNLVIRENLRKFILDVRFETPHRVEVQRGQFKKSGFEFFINPKLVCFSNNLFAWSDCKCDSSKGIDFTFWSVGCPSPPTNIGWRLPIEMRHVINPDSVRKWIRLAENKDIEKSREEIEMPPVQPSNWCILWDSCLISS